MGLPLRERGLVILDVHRTVFNGYECHQMALLAAQKKCLDVSEVDYQDLKEAYHQASADMCSMYRDGRVEWDDRDETRIRRMCRDLDLDDPTEESVNNFLSEYDRVWHEEMRPLPFAVDALVRLGENGYKLCFVVDGLKREGEDLAEDLGVEKIIDDIVGSDQTGHSAADPRTFQFVVDRFGAAQFADKTSVVIGARPADVMDAADTAFKPIVYDPRGYVPPKPPQAGKPDLATIRHLSGLLPALDEPTPCFTARFTQRHDMVTMEGFGVDLVTERRLNSHMTANEVRRQFDAVAVVLVAIAMERHIDAMATIERMIMTVADAALDVNEAALCFNYPGRREDRGMVSFSLPGSKLTHRKHSVYAEYTTYTFATEHGNEEVMAHVGANLQEHFQHLMADDPLSAMRRLRSAMIRLSRAARTRQSTTITGEGIEVLAFNDDRDELREIAEQARRV